jgi:hypothetical protein
MPWAQRSCKMMKEAREREHMTRRAEVTPNRRKAKVLV